VVDLIKYALPRRDRIAIGTRECRKWASPRKNVKGELETAPLRVFQGSFSIFLTRITPYPYSKWVVGPIGGKKKIIDNGRVRKGSLSFSVVSAFGLMLKRGFYRRKKR